MTREEKFQIGMFVMTIVLVCVLIIAIVTLARYAEEIKTNPIDYAINNGNIKSCVCYNDVGQTAYFGEHNAFNISTET